MNLSKESLRKIRNKLKELKPGGYAVELVERLNKKGTKVTLQMVYNAFNDIPCKQRHAIITAAIEVLAEAKKKAEEQEDLINNLTK